MLLRLRLSCCGRSGLLLLLLLLLRGAVCSRVGGGGGVLLVRGGASTARGSLAAAAAAARSGPRGAVSPARGPWGVAPAAAATAVGVIITRRCNSEQWRRYTHMQTHNTNHRQYRESLIYWKRLDYYELAARYEGVGVVSNDRTHAKRRQLSKCARLRRTGFEIYFRFRENRLASGISFIPFGGRTQDNMLLLFSSHQNSHFVRVHSSQNSARQKTIQN